MTISAIKKICEMAHFLLKINVLCLDIQSWDTWPQDTRTMVLNWYKNYLQIGHGMEDNLFIPSEMNKEMKSIWLFLFVKSKCMSSHFVYNWPLIVVERRLFYKSLIHIPKSQCQYLTSSKYLDEEIAEIIQLSNQLCILCIHTYFIFPYFLTHMYK